MNPRILFVGGEKGSWQCRAVQLVDVLGARAVVDPMPHDWEWAQIVVLVKRGIFKYGELARQSGLPVVWDVLDCWRQPEENQMSVDNYAAAVRGMVTHFGVTLAIGATKAMAEAIGGVYIPHHAHPKLKPQSVREQVEVVAYEGTPKYLGSWKAALEQICAARGWRFVVNPPSLADADIVVALRDGQWDGPVCREWKSGVKLVNAMAAGRPVITQPSAADREIDPPGSVADTVELLTQALDHWAPLERRRFAAEICRSMAMAYTRSSIAHLYREHLFPLARKAA